MSHIQKSGHFIITDTNIQWTDGPHEPSITLTRSPNPKRGQMQVIMIPIHQLTPKKKYTDSHGTLKEDQHLCSGWDEFRITDPTQRTMTGKRILLDDLSISWAFALKKITKTPEHKWNLENLSFLPRFTKWANIDPTLGHYGKPALVRVDGKLYPLIVKGQYILMGNLVKSFDRSSHVCLQGISVNVPFLVLDEEVDPLQLKPEDRRPFDDYFDLTEDQYRELFVRNARDLYTRTAAARHQSQTSLMKRGSRKSDSKGRFSPDETNGPMSSELYWYTKDGSRPKLADDKIWSSHQLGGFKTVKRFKYPDSFTG